MNRKSVIVSAFAAVGIAGVMSSVMVAHAADEKHAMPDMKMPEMKLPAGWTEADMQACMAAGMPGEHHATLAKRAGEWYGKQTMWMGPETEPVMSECTVKMTPMLDGHFVRSEWSSEIPGMGAFKGEGTYGYDNVSKQFVSTWIDNHGTGITTGTGEMSADGRTITWTNTFNCPITKKACTMRETDRMVDADTFVMEIFSTDPKSGREYKMLSAEIKRKN